MPSIFSKLVTSVLMPDWVFRYNCYEVAHTWTPHCTDAALDMGLTVFGEGLKMYSALYLASQLIFTRKHDMKSFGKTLRSVLTSSTFLGFNAWAMFSAFCLLRNTTGKIQYSIFAFLPAFVGSLMAIFLERPARRGPLAIYCANIASECVFRIGEGRGYYKPIPRGEVLLFTVSMGVLLYMIKKNGYGQDPVSLAVKFLLGRDEAKRRTRPPVTDRQVEKSKAIGNFLTLNGGHKSCPHVDEPCLKYIAKGALKPLLVGWMGQTLLMTLLGHKKFLKKPSVVFGNLVHSKSVNFGLFLGGFVGTFKAVNCVLRHATGGAEDWQALVGALCAGPAMLFSPNPTITMYVTWKCIESLYGQGVKQKLLRYPQETSAVLYALSVAIIFYTGVLEPSKIRPSYMKFIDRVTEHKLHLLNRNLLDVFGTGASQGYEDFFPDLDLSLCSPKFIETVFLWVI